MFKLKTKSDVFRAHITGMIWMAAIFSTLIMLFVPSVYTHKRALSIALYFFVATWFSFEDYKDTI